MQVPIVSSGSDLAPIQRALLSGLFMNAAVLLPDSELLRHMIASINLRYFTDMTKNPHVCFLTKIW